MLFMQLIRCFIFYTFNSSINQLYVLQFRHIVKAIEQRVLWKYVKIN